MKQSRIMIDSWSVTAMLFAAMVAAAIYVATTTTGLPPAPLATKLLELSLIPGLASAYFGVRDVARDYKARYCRC